MSDGREIESSSMILGEGVVNMRVCIWAVRMGVLSYAVCCLLEIFARLLLNMPIKFKLLEMLIFLCMLLVFREGNALGLFMHLRQSLPKWLDMLTLKRMKDSPAASSSDEAFSEELQVTHEHVHSQDLHKFCSLFTLSYEFEKNTMVQMWVAEGLFEPETSVPMEISADHVFDYLVQEKVIQPTGCCNTYRMHNANKVQGLLSAGSQANHKFIFKGVTEPMRVFELADHHVSTSSPPANEYRVDESKLRKVSKFTETFLLVSAYFNPLTFHELSRFHNLCTIILVCEEGYSVKHILDEVFFILKNLRLLDLHHTGISELPRSIENLKCLRYLDMSETPIQSLPRGIVCLSELQTLKLGNCFDFKELPRGIDKLTNLRHLDLDIHGLRSMPVGIGNLTRLQTLSAFIIDNIEGCRIGELKNLNNLKGSLRLTGLESVFSPEEAAEANIIKKKYLTNIKFSWSYKPSDKPGNQDKILDRLQPHSSIKELEIANYNGLTFPNWLSDPIYANIVELRLRSCGNCHHLPSLGELRGLRSLSLSTLAGVKSIDHLFRSTKKCFVINAFPRLEKLEILDMINLQIWSGIKKGDFPNLEHLSVSLCPKLPDIPFLSYISTLKYLNISDCPTLQSLPRGRLSPSLETFCIYECPELGNRCLPDGKDWFKIAHVPFVHIDDQSVNYAAC